MLNWSGSGPKAGCSRKKTDVWLCYQLLISDFSGTALVQNTGFILCRIIEQAHQKRFWYLTESCFMRSIGWKSFLLFCSEAELYLFGACVTSWKVDSKDLLFVRPDAVFNGQKPIRSSASFQVLEFGHTYMYSLKWPKLKLSSFPTQSSAFDDW